MRDRQTEALYYPRPLLQCDAVGSVLCLAPHPDDEVLGCGGVLALLADAGVAVHTLILSGGERATGPADAELGRVRREESRRAARLLGVPEPRFGDFSDRELVYAAPLIDAVARAIAECQAEWVLAPALAEPHPDHQAVALAALAAVQGDTTVREVLFYEIGAPLVPNLYADITAVAARKWQAVAAFQSQLGLEAYEPHARAFAQLRAFGLGSQCTEAEALFRVEVAALREQGPVVALPHWPVVRSQQQLANATAQLPLVSVLVRSVDRGQLQQALGAIVAQTYSHLEVVVVNASGHAHSPIHYPPQRLRLRVLEPDAPQPGRDPHERCNRPQAANTALRAAAGSLALFLDDDDLIAPQHIERLVATLQAHPFAVGAYAGVRVEGPQGLFQRNYDLPWSRHRLMGINYLPIHAVLFRVDRARDAEVFFDETLPVLEDWDFWCRLTQLDPLVHCPGVSAVYRQGNGDSGLTDPDHSHHWKQWHGAQIRRFVERSTPQELAQTLAWHAIELDALQLRHDTLAAHLAEARAHAVAMQSEFERELASTSQRIEAFSRQSQASIDDKERQYREAAHQTQVLQARIAEMQRMVSWRITAPFRRLRDWLRSL